MLKAKFIIAFVGILTLQRSSLRFIRFFGLTFNYQKVQPHKFLKWCNLMIFKSQMDQEMIDLKMFLQSLFFFQDTLQL